MGDIEVKIVFVDMKHFTVEMTGREMVLIEDALIDFKESRSPHEWDSGLGRMLVNKMLKALSIATRVLK